MTRILIVCPAPAGSRLGNRVTAERWSRLLRDTGRRAAIRTSLGSGEHDALVAIHARKSAGAVRAFRRRHPERPLVVLLSGTDLYGDLDAPGARASLALADRLVLLQAAGRARLPAAVRRKARVVHQSVSLPAGRPSPSRRHFEICVLAHLRPVKDPFRAALAARGLPADSRIRIVHAGRALDERSERRALEEQARNPRYRWLGERSHAAALRILARSRALCLSSRSEGGANVIGEAATLGVPILASRIEGTVGLVGARHPGLYPLGDTQALRELMLRTERDEAFREKLAAASRRLAPLFEPEREREAIDALMDELGV